HGGRVPLILAGARRRLRVRQLRERAVSSRWFWAESGFPRFDRRTRRPSAGLRSICLRLQPDTGSRTVFLHDLFVRSACRGQGIAEAVMRRLMEICKAAGATSMSWLVWHTNESAIRFYERMGAHSVDTVRFMRIDL